MRFEPFDGPLAAEFSSFSSGSSKQHVQVKAFEQNISGSRLPILFNLVAVPTSCQLAGDR
jgi:hypothetical protein